jgi:hypothetical protein
MSFLLLPAGRRSRQTAPLGGQREQAANEEKGPQNEAAEGQGYLNAFFLYDLWGL